MSKIVESRTFYDMAFRGLLTENALDRAGRTRLNPTSNKSVNEITDALNLDLFDTDDIQISFKMSYVYISVSAFEKSARKFIAKVLQSSYGDNWWDSKVSEKIRKLANDRREEENTIKWHGTRGDDPITYTEMGHLANIIEQNWNDFEPHIRRLEWAKALFSTIERSRNVIMHTGTLEIEDIERLGMNIRDWVKQVGS